MPSFCRVPLVTIIVWLIFGLTPLPATEFHPLFFAFQTGFANAESQDADYLAELVKLSGFDGVELMGLDRVEAFLPELRSRKLRVYSLYVKLDLDADQPYDVRLKPLLQKHRGDILNVWFHIHSRQHQKSDPTGDARCVELLREISDFTTPLGINVGIYHHVGLWAERFGDGVRIAQKVDRKNVGAVFNLCHYLRMEGPENLEQDLSKAFPHVILVSINGADQGDTKRMGWDRLIQPLGHGTFDVSRVLKTLKQQKYTGPIGLQGFAIPTQPEKFFPASVKAYESMLDTINQPKDP